MRGLGWLLIPALVALGLLFGFSAAVLVLAWVLLSSLAVTFAWRDHPHLKETGVPASWRLKASETLHVVAGGLVLLAASTMVAGTLGRIAFATVLPALSYWRLRQLWALPGADRVELAAGVVRDRQPVLAKLVAAAGVVLLVVGAALGLPFAGLPLMVGLGGLVAWGWGPAKTRQVTVARLQATVANAARVRDPLLVAVEPTAWLAGSDDVLDLAEAQLPADWLPPEDPRKLADALGASGWDVVVDAEARHLGLARAEPVPDRVEWDGMVPTEHGWFLLGVGEGDRRLGWDLTTAPHALFTGATGTGKTSAILHVIVQAACAGYRVWALDPKESEFHLLEGRVERVARGLDECWVALIDAEQVMRDRQALMRERGVRNWAEVPDLAPMLVVVDEAFDLLAAGVRDKERKGVRDEAADALGSLARLGRAPGVHLLAAAQRPDARVLSGELRNNLRARLLLGEALRAEVQMVLDGVDDPDALMLGAPPAGWEGAWPPKGRGVIQEASPSRPETVQCVYVTDAQVEQTLDALQAPAEQADDHVPAAWDEQYANDGGGGDRIALDLDGDDQDGGS